MRRTWAILLSAAFVALSLSPAVSACIPGMPEQRFEPQAIGTGPAFVRLSQVTRSTIEEMFPQVAVFKDRLFVAWQLEDFNVSVKFFSAVSSFDGKAWSAPAYLSSPDITRMVRSQLNVNPRMAADDRGVYVVWGSNEPNWTDGPDDDIVFRHTEDGTNWSDVIEVTGPENTGLDKLPRVVPMGDKVWFLWETTDPHDSDGADMDIVMRSWDRTGFGPVIEATPKGDVWNDENMEATADGRYLYVTWTDRNQSTGDAKAYEVWGRVFDGEGWVTDPMKLTGGVLGYNANTGVAAADGRCHFIWETADTATRFDPSAIVIRPWDLSGGLGARQYVSSITGKGEDQQPYGSILRGSLYVVWVSTDDSIVVGGDPDLVYRVGTIDAQGVVRFGDFNEVSSPNDDYRDNHPLLVAYDDILYCVWTLDFNYTPFLSPKVLEPLGGYFRSSDVVIQAIDVPFEKSISIVYMLGTGSPVATLPTTAEVTVKGIDGYPARGLDVVLALRRAGANASGDELLTLRETDLGTYTSSHVVLSRPGEYTLRILVHEKVVGSFAVTATAPPPSFVSRVPWAAAAFVAAGIVVGLLLDRMMGRASPAGRQRLARLEAVSGEGR